MKIAYSHLVQHIEENPSIENISNKLFQLGHEHEIDGNIFDMEFTPNRGDCLSINGLLRDLAVFYTVDINQEIFPEKLNELELILSNKLSEQVKPIWPSLLDWPIFIDKTLDEKVNNTDEYIFWAN